MKFKKTVRERAFDGAILIVLGVIMLVTLVPILYVTIMSFFNTNNYVPQNFSIGAYQYIFSTSTFVTSIGVSTFVTVVGTGFSMLVTVLMAYSLSCKQLRGRSYFLFFIVFTMMFNGGMIPTFLIVKETGLYNSIWSLIIPSAVTAYNLILMKNYFQELPDDIKESARIDGCHELRIVFQIILPISLPILATISLFYAVAKWNIFMDALLYITKSQLWPVQVLLRNIIFVLTGGIGDTSSDMFTLAFSAESIKAAVIVVSSLPIVIVYPFLQKYFTKGLLMGSIKG